MLIESPRFGTLEIEPARIVEFPQGLAGFEHLRRFTLFHPEGSDPKYFILQSVDDPEIAFHIADPAQFGFAYEIVLGDAEMALLQLVDPAGAVVAVVLLRDTEGSPLRANLDAPLIINVEARLGLQHVFAKLDYSVTLKG